MAPKPTSAEEIAQQNGQPETITLELLPQEVQLLHNLLTQASFPEALAKQVAASVQTKIEQAVQQ